MAISPETLNYFGSEAWQLLLRIGRGGLLYIVALFAWSFLTYWLRFAWQTALLGRKLWASRSDEAVFLFKSIRELAWGLLGVAYLSAVAWALISPYISSR